ncbi:MAG: hypothetical protein GWM88_09175 [Pseudomonadales bacterium]|nr:hypothetical protein [Pseudomonadales bacterium]NIX08168.1 hypothetical protein [Pseudomonadales bacterium]
MDIDEVVSALRTERDELRVRLHLLKAEARDEFEELEKKWQHLESRAAQVKEGAKESAEDIGAAAKTLAEEIGAAYTRIKKTLS